VYSLKTFTAKFGAPTDFLFKGQVWDSRNADSTRTAVHCDVCSRKVRFVFILKRLQTADPTANPEVGKLDLGRCCFHYFRRWNPKLHGELLSALEYERNREAAAKRDKRLFAEWAAIKIRVKEWRNLRRQGEIRLRQLRQMNASAPVNAVTALVACVGQTPQGKNLKWFDRQIQELRQRIGELGA
jgi:hypothetical protein